MRQVVAFPCHRKPILTLPPIDSKAITVEFSPAERQFYDELHRKSLSLFQGFVEAGTASKSWLGTLSPAAWFAELWWDSLTYSNRYTNNVLASLAAIFSLLHRLRQACDHVALTVKSHLDEEDWNTNVIAKNQSEQKREYVTRQNKKNGDDTIDENVSAPCLFQGPS